MLKAKGSKAEPEIKVANIKFVAQKETKGHKVAQTLDRKRHVMPAYKIYVSRHKSYTVSR